MSTPGAAAPGTPFSFIEVLEFVCNGDVYYHFLEAAQFPKAPVLAGCKVNFTLRPAKRPVPALAPLVEEGGLAHAGCGLQVDRVPPSHLTPSHSVWALKQPLSLSYLISSYLILSVLICIKIPINLFFIWHLGFILLF